MITKLPFQSKFTHKDKNSKENFTIFHVDNRWIVPNNLYLSTKYNCHINGVEEIIDEIKEYIEARYISAIEEVWHMFSFVMYAQDPPVIRLETHLEDKNTIIFKDNQKLVDIKNKNKMTKLTAYFYLNTVDENC